MAHQSEWIDPLQRAWCECRTFGAFRTVEAVLWARKTNPAFALVTDEHVHRMAGNLLDQPMPWDFTWREYEYLMGD